MRFKEMYNQTKKIPTNENLFEFITYKNIDGTNCSYREDSRHTDSGSQRHVHAYAKKNGNGKELYSINIDGSGHDGSRGKLIPKTHADFFRKKGYNIKGDNILESLIINDISGCTIIFLLNEELINEGDFLLLENISP